MKAVFTEGAPISQASENASCEITMEAVTDASLGTIVGKILFYFLIAACKR